MTEARAAAKPVLVTGSIRFEDGLEPAFLEERPGERPARLFEFRGLLITVTAGSHTSQHRAVVSDERRFGFRVPLGEGVSAIDEVRFAKEGYRPVTLEKRSIAGDVVDLGEIVIGTM